MTTRSRAYAPPSSTDGPRTGADAAAAALGLLECDPASVLWSRGVAGSSAGGHQPARHKSAAKLARQRYEEALAGKAALAPADLLDLSPSSRSPQGDSPVGLWPGDTVLARFGPGGSFYHARVVRVYSSRGCSLVDVEYIRPPPQAGGDASGGETPLHGNGLQVGTDVRRPGAGDRQHWEQAPPPAAAAPALLPELGRSSSPAPLTGVAASLPDLLEFQGPGEEGGAAADDGRVGGMLELL